MDNYLFYALIALFFVDGLLSALNAWRLRKQTISLLRMTDELFKRYDQRESEASYSAELR